MYVWIRACTEHASWNMACNSAMLLAQTYERSAMQETSIFHMRKDKQASSLPCKVSKDRIHFERQPPAAAASRSVSSWRCWTAGLNGPTLFRNPPLTNSFQRKTACSLPLLGRLSARWWKTPRFTHQFIAASLHGRSTEVQHMTRSAICK